MPRPPSGKDARSSVAVPQVFKPMMSLRKTDRARCREDHGRIRRVFKPGFMSPSGHRIDRNRSTEEMFLPS